MTEDEFDIEKKRLADERNVVEVQLELLDIERHELEQAYRLIYSYQRSGERVKNRVRAAIAADSDFRKALGE